MPRGVIRNKELAQQIKDFSNLVYGTISPTDIDGFIDFQNRLFVFIELKHRNAQIKTGQRIALERVCDACKTEKRESVVIIGEHQTEPDKGIDVAGARVVFVRWQKRWHQWKREETISEVVFRLRKKCLLMNNGQQD
jgi:hypothetical protein